MTRILLALALLAAAPAIAKPPRLTLFITVDALGSDLVLRSRGALRGGLGQAIAQGAYFPYVRHEASETVTAVGHATLFTGAHPWRHGIVGNRVWNRKAGRLEPAFADPDHPTLEAPPANDDTSPVNLMAETLADRLRLSTRMEGKAVAISGKPRAAIAFAGRLGQAWWFNETVGKFVTGTFYAKEFPGWVKAFNEKKSTDAWLGKTWTLSAPEKSYVGEDDRPWESDWYGLGRKFPHPLGAGMQSPGPAYYSALASSPMMNDAFVQLAKAAIAGEGLGRDEEPDLLFVGFSALDRIYHLFGPYSWEMQDAVMRLDRSVGELVAAAEKAAGKGNLLVVITADHGGAPVPEELTTSGLIAGRLYPKALKEALGKELRRRFNADLVLAVEEGDIYLDHKVIADKSLDGATVRRAAAAWLGSHAQIQAAVASDDLAGSQEHAGLLRAMRLGYFPGRSGDIIFVPKQYQVVTDEGTGTNHATPYSYDALVPLVFWGKGIRPGVHRAEISAIDVAPTTAALLELAPPALSEGVPRTREIEGR